MIRLREMPTCAGCKHYHRDRESVGKKEKYSVKKMQKGGWCERLEAYVPITFAEVCYKIGGDYFG